jgi:hypothetical protein
MHRPGGIAGGIPCMSRVTARTWLHVSYLERMLYPGRWRPEIAMSFGIIEVITLLLGMAGFGLQANPKPPTADQSLQYAIADADFAAHIDAASVVPANYKLLAQFADQPQIKSSPELQKLVRKAIGEIEGARGAAKMATGVDVTTDISDATAFVQVVPQSEPKFVVAVRGRFSPANLDKVAKMVNKSAAKLGGGLIVEIGASQPAIGLTKDGVVLVGTPGLVRERLADGWKPPSRDAGTNLGYLAEAISARPVFAVVMTMSSTARAEALKHLAPHGFASDVVARHKAAAFSIFHDGVGWTWVDTTRPGVDAMELVSSGALDLMRSAQVAPRGIAKIAMGVLDSYRGTDAKVDDLIKRKADLLKIVETYTGDGAFKVAVEKKGMRLAVRATGKTVSEVLPFGLMLPAAVLGLLANEARDAPLMIDPSPPPAKAPAAKSPPQPAKQPAPPAKRP